jgi:hypothetical protein
LDDHEGHCTPIDLFNGDFLNGLLSDPVDVVLSWGHTAQIEQCEAKGWVHERRLHVHSQQHTEPNQVNANLFCDWTNERNDDEGQLKEV